MQINKMQQQYFSTFNDLQTFLNDFLGNISEIKSTLPEKVNRDEIQTIVNTLEPKLAGIVKNTTQIILKQNETTQFEKEQKVINLDLYGKLLINSSIQQQYQEQFEQRIREQQHQHELFIKEQYKQYEQRINEQHRQHQQKFKQYEQRINEQHLQYEQRINEKFVILGKIKSITDKKIQDFQQFEQKIEKKFIETPGPSLENLNNYDLDRLEGIETKIEDIENIITDITRKIDEIEQFSLENLNNVNGNGEKYEEFETKIKKISEDRTDTEYVIAEITRKIDGIEQNLKKRQFETGKKTENKRGKKCRKLL